MYALNHHRLRRPQIRCGGKVVHSQEVITPAEIVSVLVFSIPGRGIDSFGCLFQWQALVNNYAFAGEHPEHQVGDTGRSKYGDGGAFFIIGVNQAGFSRDGGDLCICKSK